MPVVKDGKKGETGDDGRSAYTLDLTNENASVPCDYNGNVVTSFIQGTVAKVYYGGMLQNDWSFSASFDGCSGSINASTGVVSISGISGDEASVTITASKSGFSSMVAVYTLCKIRGGENGEPAVVYSVAPDVAVVRVSAEGRVVPSAVGCRKFKQVGSGVPMETQDGNLVYRRSTDANEQVYNSEVTISADVEYIDFILYKSTTEKVVLDKERVPVLKDGSNGESALQYQLVAPYSIISMTPSGGVNPSSFVVTCKKRVGLGEYSNCSDFYLLVWRWDDSSGSWDCINTNGYNKSATITVTIDGNSRYTMYKVCAYVAKPTSSTSHDGGTEEVEPRVFNVVRDGRGGAKGDNGYFPRDRGFYEPGETYYWRKEGNETYRDKVVCEIEGTYYNFLVAAMNNEAGVTARPTLSGGSGQGSSDGNWEVMSVYRTLIVDTLFGSNANIGGFMTTNETMISQSKTNGEANIYMNGKTGEFRCTNAFVRGQIEATSGSIEGELSVGSDFKINGTSDWQQGIYYQVSDSSKSAYGQWKFQPRNVMVVPRNSLLEENDAQVNCLMYLERARNNQLDRVFYAKGISEFNGRVAISSYNAQNTTASYDKPALVVEGGVAIYGGLNLNVRSITSNGSTSVDDGVIIFNNTKEITFTFDDSCPVGRVIYLKRATSYKVYLYGNFRACNSVSGGAVSREELGAYSMMYVKTDSYWTGFYCG